MIKTVWTAWGKYTGKTVCSSDYFECICPSGQINSMSKLVNEEKEEEAANWLYCIRCVCVQWFQHFEMRKFIVVNGGSRCGHVKGTWLIAHTQNAHECEAKTSIWQNENNNNDITEFNTFNEIWTHFCQHLKTQNVRLMLLPVICSL